jgi:triacylglycerol lipase
MFWKSDISSENLMRHLAIMSNAASDAYLSAPETDWSCDWQLVSKDGSECLMITDSRVTILAFRGTSDFRDCRTDADARKLFFDGIGHIHAGFGHSWRSLEHSVLKAIPVKTQELWITGHSLGGALATVAAQALNPLFNIRRVVTFGSPRVCGPETAHSVNWNFRDKIYRVVHSNDIVPRVPGPFRFRHVGIPILIKETPSDKRLTAQRVVFGATFFDLLFERIVGFRFDGLRDHSMDNYKRLTEIVYPGE